MVNELSFLTKVLDITMCSNDSLSQLLAICLITGFHPYNTKLIDGLNLP